jgi:hypothetical protein
LADSRLIAIDQAIIHRIDATHAGDEYKIPGTRSQTPGASWRDRTFGRKNADALP